MPVYEYACGTCGARTEERRPIQLGPRRRRFRCPACGERTMRPVVSQPGLRTDTNFPMQGKVYPGINHNQPITSRSAFLREVASKGLDWCSVKEIARGPKKSLDRVREEQFAEAMKG
ncbi:MAG TPA: FmdB family zinc ribbon protein [Phycisphaerae bacterium]|nr:FmdB family zinc ribbon protein [Phycisphaerae bacterium]